MKALHALWQLPLAGLLLFGCARVPQPNFTPTTTPYQILFLSPQLRYNDMGFVRHNVDSVVLEIYALGKPLYKINIDEREVCVPECYPKRLFIQHLFGDFAPSSLLEDILLLRDIYGGENLTILDRSVVQEIVRQDSAITYMRSAHKMVFEDSVRKVRIVLEDVKF